MSQYTVLLAFCMGDFDVIKKRSLRKLLISFSITVGVAVLVAAGIYAAMRRFVRMPDVAQYVIVQIPVTPSNRPQPSPNRPQDTNPDAEYITERFYRRAGFHTFLIFGRDEGLNMDTIMVAAFDTQSRNAYIVSLPRDTRVESDRRQGRSKLVASYAVGRQGGGGHEGGVEQLMTEVQSLIGFRPDYYVSVDLQAFIRLVDTIGGVEVTVPFHMRYTDPIQNLHIDLPAGTRRLNGQQASHFARFRLADEGFRAATDIQRTQHQQMILRAAMNELLSPRTITRLPELVRIYMDNVTTDLGYDYLLGFANDIRANGIANLHTETIPIDRTIRAGWYEVPCKEGTLDLVNRTINPFEREILPEMLRIVP